MSWKVRHEGSPQHVEGLTAQQAAQGLADRQWEPTDEVMGPQDRGWVAFENHPLFAEVAMDVEPREPKPFDEEARLDMNALIDVCLVLLIFFILTTTYTRLQKIIVAPNVTPEANDSTLVVNPGAEEVQNTMIHVLADMQNGAPAIFVEKELVPFDSDNPEVNRRKLMEAFQKFEGGAKKLRLLLEHDDTLPHGVLIQIQDAAKSVKMDEVLLARKVGR